MKNFFILSTLALIMISCNPNPAQHPNDSVAHDTAPADTLNISEVPLLPVNDSLGQCFSFEDKNEQRFMRLWREGISVHGQLDLKEGKQNVSGSFEGTIINDTMWIMHKSVSEGNKRKREMVYVLSGDKLYEGQGMQETKDDFTFTFRNRKTLEFSKEPSMTKADCR